MDHYLKEFKNNQKRITLREQASQETLKDKQINEDDLKSLSESYNYYKYRKYGIRTLPLFIAMGYTLTSLAKKPSPLFYREIFLIISMSIGVLQLDHYNSTYFWKDSSDIVKNYVNYSDLMVIDDKRLQDMRSMYERQKLMSQKQSQQIEKKDQLYDDDD